jgi:hypothetical protein
MLRRHPVLLGREVPGVARGEASQP